MKYKLGELCTVIADGSHNPPKGTSKSEYLMLSSKNVQDDCITFEEPRYLSSGEYEQENKRTTITAGDVLLTIVGTVGRCAVVPENCGYLTLQRSVAVLKPRNDICKSRYLMYALISKRALFETEARGVAQKGIYLKQLSQIEIPVPNPQKQEEIISLLDKAQSIISARKQQITELDNLIKARFVEIFGDPDCNPNNWKKTTIGKVIQSCEAGWSGNGTQREKNPGEIAVLKVSAVTKGFFVPEECKVLDNQSEIKKYVFPQKGDLLFSRANTREMVGATAVILQDYPELILPDKLWKIRFVSCANVLYMKHILSHASIRAKFSEASTGTSGSMFNVSMEKFKAIVVPLPPIELQEQFAAFVEQVDKSKVVVQRALLKQEKCVQFDIYVF